MYKIAKPARAATIQQPSQPQNVGDPYLADDVVDGGQQNVYKQPPASANKATTPAVPTTRGVGDSLNRGLKYVQQLPGKAKSYAVQKGIQATDKLFRDRYGARKGVPMDEALARLAHGEIAMDVVSGRYLPGVAKRDSSGNIMSSTYPYRTHGRNPHSGMRPGHERGIEPGTEFVGPPQPLLSLSGKSWDYAKKREQDLKRYGSYANPDKTYARYGKDIPGDIGYAESTKGFGDYKYMPQMVLDDMDERYKAFGDNLGFTSQNEYDDHVKNLIDQEVRFRERDFRERNKRDFKDAATLAASLGGSLYLGPGKMQFATTLGGVGRAGVRAFDSGKNLYETYYDQPPGFVGRSASASSLYNDVLNSDKPGTQELRDGLNRDIAQALYSGYESGELRNVYNRLKGFMAPAKPSVTPDSNQDITESAASLSQAMRNLALNVQYAKQDPRSPFNSLEGIKHLANSELFDRMTARQLHAGSQLNRKDYFALGKSALGATRDTLVDYAKNNPIEAAAMVLPGASVMLPKGVRVPLSVQNALVKPTALYRGNRQSAEEYEHTRRQMEAGRSLGPMGQTAKRVARKRFIEGAPGVVRDILDDNVDQPGYLSSRAGIAANKLVDEYGASTIQDLQLDSGYSPDAFPQRDARGKKYTDIARELLSDTGRATTEMGNIVEPLAAATTAYRAAKPYLQSDEAQQTQRRGSK